MSPRKLRAVIFDYGMVLSQPPQANAHAAMLRITGLEAEAFDRAYWQHRPAYDLGTLNGAAYWPEVARSAGIDLTAQQVAQLIEQDVVMWTSANPVMLDWVRRVRESGLRIAILSNMGQEIREHMSRSFSWLEDFDHRTWSYELGIAKPDVAIYQHTLEQLGVSGEEALFIDDVERNVRGAEAVGIRALVFTTVERLQADLERLGLSEELPPLLPAPTAGARTI